MDHQNILNENTYDFRQTAVIKPPAFDGIDAVNKPNVRFTRVVVDSRDRNNVVFPDPNRYEIRLDEEIEDVLSVELITADVPFSSYLINQSNNILNVNYNSGVITGTATLTTGDYTAADLASELQLQLNAVAVGSFVVTYDSRKDNYVIRSNASFTIDFPILSNLTRILGFQKVASMSSTDETGYHPDAFVHVVRSQYRRNFEDVSYLIMDVALLTVNTSINNTTNRSFAVINRSGYMNTFITRKIKKTFNPPVGKFDKIKIEFFDYEGNLYDFQNQDHRFELLFESYRQTRRYRT